MKGTDRDGSREELERAMDTVAAMLRAYGAHAFDLGELGAHSIRESCETWAQRILIGQGAAPPPGERADKAEKGHKGMRRDFSGVRSFFAEGRRRESEFVQRSLRDLRQAIWLFVRGLSRTVSEERLADGEAQRQLERLAAAVDSASAEQLKREAETAMSLWSRHLSDRQGRQRSQLKELQARLSQVQDSLGEPEGARPALDPLTKLPTQGALMERLARLTDLGLVLDRPFGLLLLDVDHLRGVNEARGLPAGDALLRDLGRQLLRQFSRRDDFVARVDGGTFAVLLPEATLPGALGAAGRARQALIGAIGGITVAIGVAQYRAGEGADGILQRARQAMARAKQGGGIASES